MSDGDLPCPVKEVDANIEQLIEQLNLSLKTNSAAQRLRQAFYGSNPDYQPLQKAPTTVAAACVYVASQWHEDDITQKQLADVANKSTHAIRQAVTHIADELAADRPLDEQ